MGSLVGWLSPHTKWKLISLDDGTIVNGQFISTNVVEDVGADWAEQETLGRSQAILQWKGEKPHRLSFQARVHARHNTFIKADKASNILDLVNAIRGLAQEDPDLGRAHVYALEIGRAIFMNACVVESVGGISYEKVRPEDGTLRGATFTITVRRYEPYDITLGKKSQAESLVLPMRERESFEALALRVYGNPDAGEALRRRNPDVQIPTAGTLIHLPPLPRLMAGFVRAPVNPALGTAADAIANRKRHFRLRGGPGRLYSVKE